jgi:hypothetical protein
MRGWALIKIISVLAVLLLAAGCGLFTPPPLPQPNYLYSAKEKDPVLIFNSEFALETFFLVNIDPASDNSCQEFRRVGHIKNVDPRRGSSRWEQIKEFKIQVPADQAVTVRAMYSSSPTSQCGPLYASFIPKKGAAYRVEMYIIPDDALSPGAGNLFGMLAASAIGGRAQGQGGSDSQRYTSIPFLDTIIGGCDSSILCDDESPPYGYCRLRITNDADKSPVKVTSSFKFCKPS